MTGNCNPSKILDLNEAIILGEMLTGKSLSDVIEILQADFKIVFLDSETLGDDIDLMKLKKLGAVTIYHQTDKDEIKSRIQNANVVITNKHYLGEEELKDALQLKLICVTATGVNNIDLEYCKKAGITVCNVKGYSTNAVAQHTFALLLDLYNKNHYYHDYIDSGNYSSSSMFTHLGHTFHELANKTWGIVGMGDIGRKVAAIASAFDCKVQYYSTSGKNNQQNYQQVDFDTLLKTSDIISIHAPLNKQTENLFNKDSFKKMKSTAYLINVGRGKIVNENDLAEAIKNHSIAGAGFVQKDAEAGGYEYGVAPRPEKINLQQGTDIYMFDSATPEQRTAAFEFMKFLATPDSQLYWAQQTGYMPILESVLHSDEYKNSKTTKVPAQLENAVKDLFAIPVEENADSAYNEMRTIMESIFASSNKDTKKLLKDATSQFEQAWNQ